MNKAQQNALTIKNPIHFQAEIITPDRARELLALNTLPSQRNLGTNRGAYKMAVTAIRAGQWHLTHQGIAISDKGHLLDGQHRLHAVIETGIAINSIVAYGVPEESFTDIDSGAARRTADFLSGKYAGDRTTVVRTLLAIEAADGWARPESIRPDSSTRRQEVEYYEARPDLQEYIDKYAPAATRIARTSTRVSRASLLVGGWVAGINSGLPANEMHELWWGDLEQLAAGNGLPDGNPVKALVWGEGTRARTGNGSASAFLTATLLMHAIYAADKYRNGQPLKRIRSDSYSSGVKVW